VAIMKAKQSASMATGSTIRSLAAFARACSRVSIPVRRLRPRARSAW
jgi:hypothetical protein